MTAALIVLVIRTKKPFWRSKPGTYLLIATVATVVVSLLLPYTPLAGPLGFVPAPPVFLLALTLIMIFYIVVAEVAKYFFYRHEAKSRL